MKLENNSTFIAKANSSNKASETKSPLEKNISLNPKSIFPTNSNLQNLIQAGSNLKNSEFEQKEEEFGSKYLNNDFINNKFE